MVCVLDHGFKVPVRSHLIKITKLMFAAFPLSMQYYGVRAKTGLFGIRIVCLKLAVYCCFSEIAL